MGFIRARARRSRAAQAVASARSPTRSREILEPRLSRASSSCSGRAASSPACSPTATSRRWSSRCAATTSTSSTRRRKAVAEVARTVPGVRDVCPSLADRLPRGARRDRPRAGRRWSASRARDAAQTTLEATLGNINTPSVWIDGRNGQSYYVVTSYDGARRRRSERARAQLPVRIGDNGGAVTLGAYGHDPPLARARSPSSATSCSARRTC